MLPKDFSERTQPLLPNEWDAFEAALQAASPPVSVRVNDKKHPLCYSERVPWSAEGYYLPERPVFTLDPLFHAGCYYVQEASSMFVEQALIQCVQPDSIVLDLCAAPGGKSTLISHFLGCEGFLVSNEIIRSRAHILSENIQKWGNTNAVVVNNRPDEIGRLTHLFDAILVDAPCSGEGMFRKDANAITEWSVNNVMLCAERQREILSSVWDALKPGGHLIYSTCTYNREENEDNVAWVVRELGAKYVLLQIDPAWQITDTALGYHFYPHKTCGEGFFLAVLKKDDDIRTEVKLKKKEMRQATSCPPDCKSWITNADEYVFYDSDERLVMFPKRYAHVVNLVHQRLNPILLGTEILHFKGKSRIPQQSFALSKRINQNNFTTFETDLQTALKYLRTEALHLDGCPLGYVLITYQQVPLGWVKNVGNRCNNLYPNEWRIRKK